ncbi:MAG: DMT family transporter [Synergistes sp.]|nr:DMT family transporter [Synergistes sp.]
MDRSRKLMLLGDFAVLMVAFIWGLCNVIIRDALEGVTPFVFCGLRFLIAWITVSLFFGRRALAMKPKARLNGIWTGMTFICAYLVGAEALLYTTAGNESFIISMSVVFVPLFVWIITRKFPGWHVVLSVVLCTIGLAGLVLDGNLTVNFGDLLAALSMLFVTAYILLVRRFVEDSDPFGLSCWQAFGGMILAAAAALIFEPFPEYIDGRAWAAIIFAGTVGFALTLVLQTVAQKYTTPTHTAILLSTSGIFGSFLGVIILYEPMTWRIFIASALILAGVLLVEAAPAVKASAARRRGKV